MKREDALMKNESENDNDEPNSKIVMRIEYLAGEDVDQFEGVMIMGEFN